jgi:peptide-methionine (S)-S-oxide reductase
MAEISREKLYPGALVTEIVDLDRFYPAEPEHDNYFARNPWSGYCRAVIAPKVQKFRKSFADRVRRPAA